MCNQFNHKKVVIFDLDGTINDSSPGIIHCFKETGIHLSKPDVPESEFRTGLSGSFVENIRRIFDLKSDEEVMGAIYYYTSIYEKTGQRMSKLFDGIEDTLRKLKSKGYKICICTMMVESYAIDTLRGYGIDGLFDSIKGASMERLIVKSEMLEATLNDFKINPSEAVLIGDGIDDYNAAKSCDIDFIGVTYGYDIKDETGIENGFPCVESPADLLKLF